MQFLLKQSLEKLNNDLADYLNTGLKLKYHPTSNKQMTDAFLIKNTISNILKLDETNLMPNWLQEKTTKFEKTIKTYLIYDKFKLSSNTCIKKIAELKPDEIVEVALLNGQTENILMGLSAKHNDEFIK